MIKLQLLLAATAACQLLLCAFFWSRALAAHGA